MRAALLVSIVLAAGAAAARPALAGTPARSPGPSLTVARTSEVPLDGGDWKLGSFAMEQGEALRAFHPEFDDRAFRIVEVPGEVQRQVGLKGMDLYYQSPSLTLLNDKEWWYRKKFTVPRGEAGKLWRLVFDGVDYFASVWLNGSPLGTHEGAYVGFSYDVSRLLRYGAENVLAVKVTCPWLPRGRGFMEYMKGNWTANDPAQRLHVEGPPYWLGPYWDAIPADGNAAFPMGLFRSVRLLASGSSVVDRLAVSTKSLNPDGSATLVLSGSIENHASQTVALTLSTRISPANFAGEPLSAPDHSLSAHPGSNPFRFEWVVERPELWWTWDLGRPSLYRLTATIAPAAGGVSDSRETPFGIRSVTLDRRDMSYRVNGRRLFLKGAWYPMSDLYGSRPTRESFRKDLELFRAANLNHLVAMTVVEKADFYDLCDTLGILVFLELPFQQLGPMEVLSRSNPRREVFVAESLRQVRQVIEDLRNHPSIVEWGAFAEAHARKGGWGLGNGEFESFGYEEYSQAVGRLVAELAPGTIYQPSYCDLGEQHFWMGSAGQGEIDSYIEHFEAQAGFVSEYGACTLPALESFRKEISPQEMWTEGRPAASRWYNLPIDVPAYAYLSSYDYDGLFSVLTRANQYVDRNVRSVAELVDDTQLYQAFLLKYATEAYRRKKYDPVSGIRIWDYSEVWPGIRWGIIDHFKVPKMGYYFLKNAQARFAVSFAYQEALESQASGKRLLIPAWVVNDHPQQADVELRCQILDLSGRTLWSGDFRGPVPADGARQLGVVEWVTPDTPGVYVLTGRALDRARQIQAQTSTYVKVTPKLFPRRLNVLLIGEKRYSVPILHMLLGMGVDVDVVDEGSLGKLEALADGEQLVRSYDVVWLAAFDSIWKLLDASRAEGLKKAIAEGVGLIHTGGNGSFHGGFGQGACLDFTPLAEVLPVKLRRRDDLVLAQPQGLSTYLNEFAPIQAIRVSEGSGPGWSDFGLSRYGVPGFNATELKTESRELLTILDQPLLVTGRYGKGRTVVFTGFTPRYAERLSDGTGRAVPYLIDQELYRNPAMKAYLRAFAAMLAEATSLRPVSDGSQILAAREEPLFEMLKNLPRAEVATPTAVVGDRGGDEVRFSLELVNGPTYARLVRVRAEWGEERAETPLVTYDDNYVDLLPGETRVIHARASFPPGSGGAASGTLVVEGTNVSARRIGIRLASNGRDTP